MKSVQDILKLDFDARALSPRAWAALIIIALISTLPGFTTLPPIDRDESRYSQAARQMMETGDYIDIRFQDQNRYVKPVGIYWLQVVTATPLGGEDAPIWAHRLPSLFATIFVVGLTAWFGTRLGGAGVGLAAGILLAISMSASVDARMAKTDAVLMAATAVSMVALYFIVVRERAETLAFRGAPLAFWAATGVGLLVKGPIILIVSVPALIVLALWRRDLSFIKRLHVLPGIAVMLAVFLPWFVAIMIETQGEFWQDSIGHALMGKVAKGDDSHGAPPGYHTLLSFVTFWPGILLIALGAVAAWQRRSEPAVQFIVAWLLPFWIIYELVATKLPHYTLPVFPALALIAAFGLRDGVELARSRGVRIAHWIIVALFALVSILIGFLPFLLAGEMETTAPGTAWLGALAGIAVAGTGIYLALKPGFNRLPPLVLSTLGVYIFTFGAVLPNMDRFWLSRELKSEITALGGCTAPHLATIDYREPSLVFNFGTETLLGDEASVLAHLAENRSCGIAAIGQGDYVSFLEAAAQAGVPLKILGQVQGYNYTKGRNITLTILSHSESEYPVPATGNGATGNGA
ncbi:ArnT family glycosyltransferase [Aquisalinus flavus]|uniref:Glycosyl transferase n=1 Tax=Aquisalinus flavus TaxID=1526572 RepID=A0A8J2V1Z5_9PROT|nr:glycosyltransferase family 39 protein [Aquisalinus flavus]GGD06675.1 glycosyl transferase [Aquisalinus flavus]